MAEIPWTDEQYNRITQTVSAEAQRTRVASKFLPVYEAVPAEDVAVANLGLSVSKETPKRFEVLSTPETLLATLAVKVYVRNHEAADPEMQAALTMFRRAANYIARAEDALMFNGQPDQGEPPNDLDKRIEELLEVSGGRKQTGLRDGPKVDSGAA